VLREAGDCEIGKGVYVSPEATVVCERLRLGDRSWIASETQVGQDVELGTDCTLNAGATLRGQRRTVGGCR